MFSSYQTTQYSYLCFLTLVFIFKANSQVVFDVSQYKENNATTHINQTFVSLTKSHNVTITNVPSTVEFFIIQVHSFMTPVTLSNYTNLKKHFYVNGTNIGLVQTNLGKKSYVFYIWSIQEWTKNFYGNVLIVISLYKEGDPIPGGCNLTFDVENAPYQLVTYTDSMVEVDVQAPSIFDKMCEESSVQFERYHLYLKERDLSSESYFEGIQKMLTVDSIRENGWKIDGKNNGYSKLRTLYSAYPGTGAIYAVIAVYKDRSAAAYVPISSYACDLTLYDDCIGPASYYWNLLYAVFIFWGLAVCFFSYNLFRIFIFTAGFMFGALLMYILFIIIDYEYTEQSFFYICISFAIVFGLLKVAIWSICGSPLLSILLAVLLNGMFISALFFYALLGDCYIFLNDVNYWIVFVSIVLSYALLHSKALATNGSMHASSFLGAIATLVALDYFVGSYLRYTVINVIRRITVTNFHLAVIHPITQIRDVVLIWVWIMLWTTGTAYQYYRNRGRAPYPPPVTRSPSEYTPLLRSL